MLGCAERTKKDLWRRLIALPQMKLAVPALVAATKEALALMQEERMPDSWLKLYHLRLVSSAADAGDLGAAEGWAAKAAKCTRDTFGADSDEYLAHVQ